MRNKYMCNKYVCNKYMHFLWQYKKTGSSGYWCETVILTLQNNLEQKSSRGFKDFATGSAVL